MRTNIEEDLRSEFRRITHEMRDVWWAIDENIISKDKGESVCVDLQKRLDEIEMIIERLRRGEYSR